VTEPNPRQRELIEGLEGVHLVDAGAGTGKTFAVTRRYASIVERPGVEPDDVLLVTFTHNAATEMKERVVARSSYGMRDLRDAPIRTFHGHCHDLLLEHGFEVPTYLGIDDRITDAIRILDDDVIEEEAFRTFYGRFIDEHPSHEDLARVVGSPMSLLELIRKLAAKGVFPTEDGWYRDGERHLDGDEAAFLAAFAAANRPRNDGRKQSRLRSKLASYDRDACYLPDAPGKGDVRGDGKAVPADVALAAFEEDRTRLKAFVHDVYHGYLAHALSRNYLTFGMLQLYAYVLLCEDHRLRETLAFEHVMVDEFQDTSEIQFKLALLACGTDNLCVVGDWKQSIYGFQYAAVENIIDFEARLDRFVEELNVDHERVAFEDRSVERVEFEENYRSTQAVLDLAADGLTVPATGTDDIDVSEVRDRVVPLRASRDHERTRLEAFRHEREHEALPTTLQAIVANDEYQLEDHGQSRPPAYADIAALTRT
jgi:superfamily I DNA/RNA helicase